MRMYKKPFHSYIFMYGDCYNTHAAKFAMEVLVGNYRFSLTAILSWLLELILRRVKNFLSVGEGSVESPRLYRITSIKLRASAMDKWKMPTAAVCTCTIMLRWKRRLPRLMTFLRKRDCRFRDLCALKTPPMELRFMSVGVVRPMTQWSPSSSYIETFLLFRGDFDAKEHC